MYADTKKSEQASKSAEKQEKAHEGHGKYLGDGRFVLLCDEPNCPLASDMNFGKEQCVFHFAATHRQKEHVTHWVTKHYSLIQIAKFYERFGVLDGERVVVLETFNRECERYGYDPLPSEDNPYFIRPIDYVQALCRQYALSKTQKKEQKAETATDDFEDMYLTPEQRFEKIGKRLGTHISEVLKVLVHRARCVSDGASEECPW